MALFLFLILHHWSGQAAEQTSTLASIENLSPASFQVTDVDAHKRGAAVLQWKPIKNAAYYEVFSTRVPEFLRTRKHRVKHNYLPVMAYVNETYYWRVVAYHKNGQRLSARAEQPFTFVVEYGDGSAAAPVADTQPVKDESAKTSEAAVETPPAPEEPWELPESQIEKPDHYKAWIGVGGGSLSFKQDHPVIASAESSGLLFPVSEVVFQTKDYWRRLSLQLELQSVAGKFSTDDSTLTLSDSKFNWLNYAAQLNGYLTTFHLFSNPTRFSVYLGYAKNETPFIESVSATNTAVRKMEVMGADLGVHFVMMPTAKSTYYFDAAYGTVLSAKSDSLRDQDIGSAPDIKLQIGANYSLNERYYLGGSLNMDQRKIDETLTTSTGTVSPGSRDLTYYGLELKLGASF